MLRFFLPEGWGLTNKMLISAVKFNLRALTNDKVFCFFLGTSVAGAISVTLPVIRRLRQKERRLAKLLRKRNDSESKKHKTSATQKKKQHKKKKKRNNELGFKFWSRFFSMLRIAVPNWHCDSARLLVVQFLFLVMRALLTVRLSQVNVELLTEAISRASWAKWARWLVNFLGWIIIGIGTNSALSFVEKCLRLALRKELTIRAHALYMKRNFFYKANVMQSTTGKNLHSLDNLDQRITSDIYEFCDQVVGLYGHSFKPALEFALSLATAIQSIGAKRPVSMFAWFFVFGGFLSAISPRISEVVASRQELEGQFRRVHARLISHAEEIAFLGGADAERNLLNQSFDDMVTVFGGHNLKFLMKKMLDQLLKFQGPLVGGIAVHVPFLLRPSLDTASRITQFRSTETTMLKSGAAFGDFLLLHKRFQRVSGYTRRVAELFESLQGHEASTVDTKYREQAEAALNRRIVGDHIQFIDLTVVAPEPAAAETSEEQDQDQDEAPDKSEREGPRLLVNKLNLSIPCGTNVMVTGPNGCGKTSLFRVLAGLWPAESGQVIAPKANVMWLPQRPYLVLGSLRDQVTYPVQFKASGYVSGVRHPLISAAEDERIIACLRKAGLDRFADQDEGLELTHHEWNSVLSGGERQRMGFARLFYAQPQYAILDESTSALNPEMEKQLYTELTKTQDVTIISIAHRLELAKYHDKELKIDGDGSGQWTLENLDRQKSDK